MDAGKHLPSTHEAAAYLEGNLPEVVDGVDATTLVYCLVGNGRCWSIHL